MVVTVTIPMLAKESLKDIDKIKEESINAMNLLNDYVDNDYKIIHAVPLEMNDVAYVNYTLIK